MSGSRPVAESVASIERQEGDVGGVRGRGTAGLLAGGLCPRLLEELVERPAVDEFHGVEVRAFGFADLVHRDDVRVVDSRGGARLAPEALDALRLEGEAPR